MHWVKIYGLVVCSALGYDLLAGGVQCIGLGSMGWWCAVNWVRIYGLVVCSALGYDLWASGVQCIGLRSMGW